MYLHGMPSFYQAKGLWAYKNGRKCKVCVAGGKLQLLPRPPKVQSVGLGCTPDMIQSVQEKRANVENSILPTGLTERRRAGRFTSSTKRQKRTSRRNDSLCWASSKLEAKERKSGVALDQRLLNETVFCEECDPIQAQKVGQMVTQTTQNPNCSAGYWKDTEYFRIRDELTANDELGSCDFRASHSTIIENNPKMFLSARPTRWHDNNSYLESPQRKGEDDIVSNEERRSHTLSHHRKARDNEVRERARRAGNVTIQMRDADSVSGCSGTTVHLHFRSQDSKRNKAGRTSPTLKQRVKDLSSNTPKTSTPEELRERSGKHYLRASEKADDEQSVNMPPRRVPLKNHGNTPRENRGTAKGPIRTATNTSGWGRRRHPGSKISQSEPEVRSVNGRSQRLSDHSYRSGSGTQEHELNNTQVQFLDTLEKALDETSWDQPDMPYESSEDSHSLLDPWVIQSQHRVSPTTATLLKAVENPRVIDSISRRDLKRQLNKGLKGAKTYNQPHRETYTPPDDVPLSARSGAKTPKPAITPASTSAHAPENREPIATNQASVNATHAVVYYPAAPMQYTAFQPIPLSDLCATQNWTTAATLPMNVVSQPNYQPLPNTMPRVLPLPTPTAPLTYYTYTMPTTTFPVPQMATYMCTVYPPLGYRSV